MRRNDADSSNGLEQFVRAPGEYADGIRIDHDRPAGLQHGERASARRVAQPGPRSDGKRGVARIGQQLGEVLMLSQRLRHDARERRGIDCKRVFRHCNRRQSGPAAGGRTRRHPRRAGHRISAVQQRMTADVLVGIRAPERQLRAPQRRPVLPGIERQRIDHAGRYADIRHDDLAACIAPGQQQMSGLFVHERHGAVGRCRALVLAAIPRDTARYVHRDDRHCAPRRQAQDLDDL